MTQDEDFSRYLRERIDAVGPAITIDTARVVPRARRSRAIARTGGALALAMVLGGAGWVVDTEPWSSSALTPAGHGSLRMAGKTGAEATPTMTPTVDPADGGWPDAPFWHSVGQRTDSSGKLARHEVWLGHTAPGLIVNDGDLAKASGTGPAAWGNLLIAGTWTLVNWDVLYSLPTDPAVLESLIRGSLEPGRGAGSDDDKVFGMARNLLSTSPAPPPLRRALWAVMTKQPGARVTTGASDATGRPGSLLEYSGAYDGEAGSYAVVFDPADGRLLEERDTSGTVTYVEEGAAADTPIKPTLESSGCVAWASC